MTTLCPHSYEHRLILKRFTLREALLVVVIIQSAPVYEVDKKIWWYCAIKELAAQWAETTPVRNTFDIASRCNLSDISILIASNVVRQT